MLFRHHHCSIAFDFEYPLTLDNNNNINIAVVNLQHNSIVVRQPARQKAATLRVLGPSFYAPRLFRPLCKEYSPGAVTSLPGWIKDALHILLYLYTHASAGSDIGITKSLTSGSRKSCKTKRTEEQSDDFETNEIRSEKM